MCATLSALSGVAPAQTLLERLIMPGPVVEGHVKLEAECGKCHEPYARASQTRLCLDCHKEIAADRAQEKRFHGRNREGVKQECNHCHTDHKGRNADITQFDRETFNHEFANFQLKDAHKSAPCEGCHRPKVIFRKAAGLCFDCHKSADPHKRQLGEKCDQCHAETKWTSAKPFDHARTKFALQGAHKDVKCATCHAGEIYKNLAQTCVSCHRLQDVHADRYGAKCESCHDQIKWKPARFDHDKTKYPLRGAHPKVKCDACHTGDLYRQKLATTCVSCHKKDDPHKGELSARCERCHNDVAWEKNVTFEHDITRFPLIGLHGAVSCEECHRSTTYKNEPVACEKCHKDWHQARLGTACGQCHNPNGWARWRFDHTRQTKYKLTGAHEKIACEACHAVKNPPNLKLATDCYACHSKADVHRGTFGRPCERCHVTTDWRKLAIRN
jgi:hypothetical protein